MIPFHLTADNASEWAGWLWSALLVVWVLLWAAMKRAKKRETPSEMLQHALPVVLGFWLLFGHHEQWGISADGSDLESSWSLSTLRRGARRDFCARNSGRDSTSTCATPECFCPNGHRHDF